MNMLLLVRKERRNKVCVRVNVCVNANANVNVNMNANVNAYNIFVLNLYSPLRLYSFSSASLLRLSASSMNWADIASFATCS